MTIDELLAVARARRDGHGNETRYRKALEDLKAHLDGATCDIPTMLGIIDAALADHPSPARRTTP